MEQDHQDLLKAELWAEAWLVDEGVKLYANLPEIKRKSRHGMPCRATRSGGYKAKDNVLQLLLNLSAWGKKARKSPDFRA